jgi:MFS family permease
MLLLGILAVGASMSVLLLPRQHVRASTPETESGADPAAPATADATGRGFPVLLAIGILDSATRMGFLTFLPYLLTAKGASLGALGLALTLVFAGGAAGKLVCGFLGARLGVITTVFLTEGLTAVGILVLLPAPLLGALAILPLVGVCLNGTSSVLYGTVPELVPPAQRTRAFSVFYTGTIGAGALSPALYGAIGDLASVPTMLVVVALLVLLTLPLAWRLRDPLSATTRVRLGPAT